MIGASLSGVTYTSLWGRFEATGHPEYVWFVLGAHTLLSIGILTVFTKLAGELKEQEA
jgi:xanthine/uracil permease